MDVVITPSAIIDTAKMNALAKKLIRRTQISGLYTMKMATPIGHCGTDAFSQTSRVD
jgi:hypothetical protein